MPYRFPGMYEHIVTLRVGGDAGIQSHMCVYIYMYICGRDLSSTLAESGKLLNVYIYIYII